MIVILEGPDGAGKTTLAEQLAKKYGLVYKHEGPPPPKVNVLEYYGQLLDEARGKNVVFDRLALGERV
jgi:MoxR-like ATPase